MKARRQKKPDPVRDRIAEAIKNYIESPPDLTVLQSEVEASLGRELSLDVHAVVSGKGGESYPAGLLIQAGVRLANPAADVTQKPQGGRGLASVLLAR